MVFPPTCPRLEMAPERSRTGELALETVVAGVGPVAVRRAVLVLLNSTMMLILIQRNGGEHSAALCHTGVLWSKQKLKLSSFQLFWACLLALLSKLLLLRMSCDKCRSPCAFYDIVNFVSVSFVSCISDVERKMPQMCLDS